MAKKKIIVFSLFFLSLQYFVQAQINQTTGSKRVKIIYSSVANSRVLYGIDHLVKTLKGCGYTVFFVRDSIKDLSEPSICIGTISNSFPVNISTKKFISVDTISSKEGFVIQSFSKCIFITGADNSGILYGCMELSDSIEAKQVLPAHIKVKDHPQMLMRGACVGLQKAVYLPGRQVYEYPYTPETFPWFYDKKMWIQFLDSMVENRMNSLYLWNGHPFASLVRLEDYPYAVEVDDITFKKNEDIFRFLTNEADKRGIYVIQMFYNILVSKPFAEKNHLKTQDRNRPIIPIIADYTRKSIAAFIVKYPNVGLGLTLGEAMEGVGQDDIDWFTKTIIPGVLDGLKILGTNEQPPIILRAHDTDAPAVMKYAVPIYKNLYTMAKYNGEALTTFEPRGSWASLHKTLSRIGTVQIENVHILANLEPFRYGADDFIQKCVQAMHRIYGANGIHLYPQASYWDWPYSADSNGTRLLQMERDWIWYKEWSRYAWNCDRDRNEEVHYWSHLLALKYGCSIDQGREILEAYEEAGEIAPKLLRRFGITDGNRQTLTLGMLMTQLINPYRYGLFDLLYDCESPEGEKLIEFAEKDWKHLPHKGETPPQIIKEVKEHGNKAVAAISAAAPFISKNKVEFERLLNDINCYKALSDHYAAKAEAALYILRYKYSNNLADLEKALPYLQQSVSEYKKLAELTKSTYLYANSMQTQQRKIPIRGVNATFKTWTEVLVPFEAELAHFERSLDSLHKNAVKKIKSADQLNNENVLTNHRDWFTIGESNSMPFLDSSLVITDYAKELKGLKGMKMALQDQIRNGTLIEFTSVKPVKVLVGFFAKKDAVFLKAPELETDATANDFGQADIKIANAIVLKGCPPVNIHSYSFPAGKNTLKLPRGACLILGITDGSLTIPLYDAGLSANGVKKEIDWLFE